MFLSLRASSCPGLLVFVVAFLPCAAPAQETAPALEEIVVTAQRREESLQSVPVAVTALDTESLERHQILDLNDVATLVPNLWMETNTGLSSGSRASMRGLGEDESFFTSDTPVGIYVDDVYIPRQTGALFDLYDVERIEVLRGPQGTLYGRNTSAGAIKLVSRKPTQDTQGSAEVSVGDYGRFDIRAGLSGGLTETLSGQVAVLSRQHDGYATNLVNGAEVNDQDVLAGKVTLRYQPTENLDALLSYDQIRERSTPGYATGVLLLPPDGLGPWDAAQQVDGDDDVHTLLSDLTNPINDLDQRGTSLNVSWDVGAVTLKSITAWRELEQTILLDGDGQNTCFGDPLPCLHLFQDQDQDQFSQELQVQGNGFDERLNYIVGAYYFNESNQQRTETIILSQFGENPYADTSLDTDSIAAFASVTWSFTEALDLTLGARWTRDSKDFASAVFESTGEPRVVCVAADGSQALSVGPCDGGSPPGSFTDELSRTIDKSWSDVSPRLALDYQLTEDAMLYGSVSKGFKSGAFDGRESGLALYSLQPIEPETSIAYEVGTKAEWLDRRLRTNLAVFQTDIDDLQGTGTNQATGTFTRFSVGDARTRGAELEVEAAPVEQLSLTASVGWLDTEFTTINFDQQVDCGPVGTGNKDLEMKFSPSLSTYLSGLYRIPIARMASAVEIGADWTRKSSFYHSSCNPVPSREDGYDIVNAQVALVTDDGRWRFAAAVQNVADEDYAAGQILIPGLGFNAIYFNPPRTWNVSARYSFE
jgi:iron complex outermembrane receptor protein